MLHTKSTPSEKAGDSQEEHGDGGNKERPEQGQPVGILRLIISKKSERDNKSWLLFYDN